MNLSELPLNKTGIVSELNCKPSLKRRFLDLGLVPGTSITPVFISPFGDPIAFEFRNTIFSIRYDDCIKIKVKIKKDVD